MSSLLRAKEISYSYFLARCNKTTEMIILTYNQVRIKSNNG